MEIPTAEQERIDQFLSDGDREQLLAGAFWHRSLQDGRSSEAMLELLDEVRQLRWRDLDINVFVFDRPPREGRTRDGEMAERIGEAVEEEPQAKFLILVGNVHARTVEGVPGDPVPGLPCLDFQVSRPPRPPGCSRSPQTRTDHRARLFPSLTADPTRRCVRWNRGWSLQHLGKLEQAHMPWSAAEHGQ